MKLWMVGWAVFIGELVAFLGVLWLYARGDIVISVEKSTRKTQMANENVFEIIERRQKKPPIDVIGLARDIGLKVYETTLPQGIYGKLTRDENLGGPSGYAIYVNQTNADVRQRFTIAHEIAHFVLHRDVMHGEIVDREMYRSDLSDKYETQANRLAAEILMPSKLIRAEFDKRPAGCSAAPWLAVTFKVSLAAMEIRLRGLGLL